MKGFCETINTIRIKEKIRNEFKGGKLGELYKKWKICG